MKNNTSKEKSFRDRIANCELERKVITQNELENIAKKIKTKNEMFLKNTDTEISIEDVLRRCIETLNDGEKYILTPQSEEINNPANIIPVEEMALMELFKTRNSVNEEVLVLLDDQRVKLEYNRPNGKEMEETIEISFENLRSENDVQYEFVN